ncbi:type IX secretion system motor protein PorM/GldM [Mucilaginibacter ginsenosidivorans]|uniref:Gliding motility protein GldM n=1 Tax=Mucilaginibacter ginsenosidivorans TaxID=398053 RepID=A0A5B8V4I4_9SPHI|nr:gliding motility protein GldM [Mucilaginibacter ginsenosidivorans]QEC65496.1 gliding motility protein GldM [Mucilaginibacter ginsenosidivorans]
MAGGKETPRQRMIGILYLVLLGLIALDVPENLLDSFKNISDSLNSSKNNVQIGINNTFDAFEKTKLKDEPERAREPYKKAKKARELATNLDAYIESLKKQLEDATGGMDAATNDYKGREDLAASDHLMVGGEKRAAYELHKRIDDTRNALLALLDPKDRVGMNLSLQATPPKKRDGFPNKDWEQANFGDGIPMGAAMTAFVKIQSDVKNSENEVIKKLLGKVDQAQVNLDQFNAVAVAPTSYVLVGQPYTADVFLTASDSKSSPEVTVDGSRLPTEGGKGKYSGSTGSEGVHTWVGTIKVKQTDGTYKTYSTPPQTYMVAKPSAVVSPDKMNVLYIGVPNPISVSAPGIAKEKLHVSISAGSLSGSAGHYIATVNSVSDNDVVTVSGEIAPGKTTVLGATKFRVKRIPDPKPQFAGKSGGNTSAANIKAQDRVFAKLDNFDFDAKFNVTRFTILVIKPRQDPIIYSATGSELTSQMRAAINTIGPGSTIVFKDIVAVGPDGTQRGLDPIVLSAN